METKTTHIYRILTEVNGMNLHPTIEHFSTFSVSDCAMMWDEDDSLGQILFGNCGEHHLFPAVFGQRFLPSLMCENTLDPSGKLWKIIRKL